MEITIKTSFFTNSNDDVCFSSTNAILRYLNLVGDITHDALSSNVGLMILLNHRTFDMFRLDIGSASIFRLLFF